MLTILSHFSLKILKFRNSIIINIFIFKSSKCVQIIYGKERSQKFQTQLYGLFMLDGMCDGRDDFGFPVAGFPFLCGSVPSSPAGGVFASQLIRCCRACSDYKDRCQLLTTRLVSQGYQKPRELVSKSFMVVIII